MELKTREERIQDYVINGFKQLIAFGDVKTISPYADDWAYDNPEFIEFLSRHIYALFELLPPDDQKRICEEIEKY